MTTRERRSALSCRHLNPHRFADLLTQARILTSDMRGDGALGNTPGDAVRKRWERLERQAMSDPRFLEEIENFRAHEQAKQSWCLDELRVKVHERAKQSFYEALARLKKKFNSYTTQKNPHRYLSKSSEILVR